MEVSGQLHTLAALPLGKVPSVPIKQATEKGAEPMWMYDDISRSFQAGRLK